MNKNCNSWELRNSFLVFACLRPNQINQQPPQPDHFLQGEHLLFSSYPSISYFMFYFITEAYLLKISYFSNKKILLFLLSTIKYEHINSSSILPGHDPAREVPAELAAIRAAHRDPNHPFAAVADVNVRRATSREVHRAIVGRRRIATRVRQVVAAAAIVVQLERRRNEANTHKTLKHIRITSVNWKRRFSL